MALKLLNLNINDNSKFKIILLFFSINKAKVSMQRRISMEFELRFYSPVNPLRSCQASYLLWVNHTFPGYA